MTTRAAALKAWDTRGRGVRAAEERKLNAMSPSAVHARMQQRVKGYNMTRLRHTGGGYATPTDRGRLAKLMHDFRAGKVGKLYGAEVARVSAASTMLRNRTRKAQAKHQASERAWLKLHYGR